MNRTARQVTLMHRVAVAAGPNLTEEWLVDPGFDDASAWDNLNTGSDVNTTFPSEMSVLGQAPYINGGSLALIRIPEAGTYRLTFPPCDHVTTGPNAAISVQFGGSSISNVSGSISAATFLAGGTFDFTVGTRTTRNFGLKFNGSATMAFAIPGLSIKRTA